MNTYIETVENSTQLSDNAKANINAWLVHDKYTFYLDELKQLIDSQNWQQLEDSFFRVIPFGTGGRRGTVGVGSNRINRVTMGEAVQALCGYLTDRGTAEADKKLAIAYDSRLTSVEFSEYAASICAANGYTAYLYDDVRSTPQLSHTVRHRGTAAGIVISASHNPSSDNGIKVYWNDGSQLVSPYDAELLAYGAVIETINVADYNTAVSQGQIVIIGAEDDQAYFDAVLAKTINPSKRSAKVAYSPLHGAGYSSVKPVLEQAGFSTIILASQANYDGHFTNVTNHICNPEVPEASDKIVAYGIEQGCDIAMTTDPDADRFGVIQLNPDGSNTFFTGNQIAVLLCDYILQASQVAGRLDGNQFIAKTIVTTDMLQKVAAKYSVTCRGNLLVGFKYIGELIKIYEDQAGEEFIFGGEESFGALVGSYARDKDAAGSALLMSELGSQLKDDGKTLSDRLDELYNEHGVFCEELDNIALKGADGFARMQHIMQTIRADQPTQIGSLNVTKTRDYLTGTEIEGRSEDVLRFEFSPDGHDRITIRPSGTEPKLKVYTQVWVPVTGSLDQAKQAAKDKAAALRTATNKLIADL